MSNCTKVCVIYTTVRLARYLGSTPIPAPLSRTHSAGIKAFQFFHSFCSKPACHHLRSLIFCWSLLSILCSTLATSWSLHLSSVFINCDTLAELQNSSLQNTGCYLAPTYTKTETRQRSLPVCSVDFLTSML